MAPEVLTKPEGHSIVLLFNIFHYPGWELEVFWLCLTPPGSGKEISAPASTAVSLAQK